MVVHQRNLLSVADRIMVMQDGTISQFGTLEELSKAAPNASVAQTRTTS
jgi:ABC-type protease/lipase transport system fused ATPase/permease subunit